MICGALPFAYFNNNNDSYSYQLVSNFHVPGSRLIFLAALKVFLIMTTRTKKVTFKIHSGKLVHAVEGKSLLKSY